MSEELNGNGNHDTDIDFGKRSGEDVKPDRVDKIRDLLFGEQMEGYDERFGDLEARLDEKYAALSEKVDRRLEEITRLLHDRCDSLNRDTVHRNELADKLQGVANLLRNSED